MKLVMKHLKTDSAVTVTPKRAFNLMKSDNAWQVVTEVIISRICKETKRAELFFPLDETNPNKIQCIHTYGSTEASIEYFREHTKAPDNATEKAKVTEFISEVTWSYGLDQSMVIVRPDMTPTLCKLYRWINDKAYYAHLQTADKK